MVKRRYLRLLLFALFSQCECLSVVGGGLAAAGFTGFFGWAFQGVGPTENAQACLNSLPHTSIDSLNALRIGSKNPSVALYCGAKVRPESYAPLAAKIIEVLEQQEEGEEEAGVLILQSPFNMYCFKPATVEKVLDTYPSVTSIVGHSIGGLWAAEYCRDLYTADRWPNDKDLSFFYMGVHGKSLNFQQFRDLPFANVAFSYASEDITLKNACGDGGIDEYLAKIRHDLPDGAKLVEIPGGNHEQYGSYGSPGYAQGLAYKDFPAKISEESQIELVATAIATMERG